MGTLGRASVQYNDFSGTVAIDGPDQPGRLYELAGLNRDEWSIIGYEIWGGYESSYAHVWAVPHGEASWDKWSATAQRGDRTTPAKRFDFQVDAEDAATLLLGTNKRWSIHALHRSLVDLGLDVDDRDAEI